MKNSILLKTTLLCSVLMISASVYAQSSSDTYSFSSIYSSVTGSSSCNISSDSGTYSELTYKKGSGNQPKYYANGTAIRMYNGNTLTVSAKTNYLITAVTLHHNSSSGGAGNVTTTNGSLSGNDYSWSNSNGVSSLDFSVGGTCRIGSIEVSVKSSSGGGGGDTPTTYTLTYSATNGSIAGEDAEHETVTSGAELATNAEVTLTANPSEGYVFSYWTVSGTGSSLTSRSTNPTTFIMGSANATVTATFVSAANCLTTMDGIYSAATSAGSTATAEYVVFDNWVVSGVSGSTAYVTDNNGKGFIVYKSDHGFNSGDILSGTAQASLKLYNGAAEFTTLTKNTLGLNVTTGGNVTSQVAAISDLGGVNTGALVQLNGVTYDGTNLKDASNNEIKPYNSLYSSMSFTNGSQYNVKGVFVQYGDTKEILPRSSSDIVLVQDPTISTGSNSLTNFTYVEGSGPSTAQTVSVSGSNLSADISLSLGDNSNYEICLTENGTYVNSLTLTESDGTVAATNVYVRLKSGLAKAANYAGSITLTSTGATNKTVSLSGSVTGQTYAIEQYSTPATAHGTITFSPESPVEANTEVTLTAEAAAGYDFEVDSWVFYKESGNDIVEDESITVTNGKITMPAYDLYVDATFTAKPTYAITCVANPTAGGTIGAQPASAYEGQSVALTTNPAEGYTLTSVVITKTSDGSATDITVTNNAFTMPGYAVTATATFLSNTFEGSFVKHSGSLTEGDYILVYNDQAMNNTVSNSKFGNTSVKDDISESTITDPLRSIVWHIAQSSTSGYWTIYNAKAGKYVCGTTSNTNVSLVDSPVTIVDNNEVVNEGAIWKVSGTYDFQCKANEGQSTARYLRNNSGSYGNYAAQNGGALTLYKLFIEPDPSAPEWSSLPASNEATVGEEFEVNLLEYVSGYPVPEITIKTTTADPLLYELADGGLRFTPNVAGSFTFAFTATNSEGFADSGTLTITATAAEVSTPVLIVDDANVSSNSALVSWIACTDATVYTIEKSESLINESFEGNTFPDTWTKSSDVSVVSGKGGDGTKSIAFKATGAYLISPAVNNPSAISFNYKRSSNSTAWGLDISYASSKDATETDWVNIGSISSASDSWQNFHAAIKNVSGTVYIRIKDTRSTGTNERYVDLIQVTGASTTTEVSGTSYTFKALAPATTYAARVQVKDAETWSNMVTFTTEAATPATKDITIADGAKYNGRYWTTFYDGSNGYKLPAGAQAFKLDDNKLVLLGDSGVVIPKGTAVVIVSDKASLTLTETNATVTVGANDLVGSATAVTVTDGKVDGKVPHVLSIKGSPTAVIGFYKFTGSSIPAGKAYVLVTVSE